MFISSIAWAASQTKEVSQFNALSAISQASFVVQMVLILLVVLSVTSWAIIFSKWGFFKIINRNNEKFLDIFWSGKSLETIYSESKRFKGSPVARVFQSGYVELQRVLEKEKKTSDNRTNSSDSALLNLERALNRAYRSESLKLEKSLSFLATSGSTAPFIGLFGTVWGIMNAFQNIGAQGSANLATVAPGIAEALIATAIGLLCAIPAVVGYNYFIGKLRRTLTQMENFSSDYLNIVKRNFLS